MVRAAVCADVLQEVLQLHQMEQRLPRPFAGIKTFLQMYAQRCLMHMASAWAESNRGGARRCQTFVRHMESANLCVQIAAALSWSKLNAHLPFNPAARCLLTLRNHTPQTVQSCTKLVVCAANLVAESPPHVVQYFFSHRTDDQNSCSH